MNSISRIAVASLSATLVACALGCGADLPGKPNPEDRPQTPAEVTDFSVLFARNCSGCHGADGTLGPAPPLNDPLFLAIVPDEVLRDVITRGRSGTPMPAFSRRLEGALTDEQIEIVAAGLKRHWKVDPRAPAELPPYAIAKTDTPPAAAAIERGEQVFAQACALCHGENGEGSGEGESPGRINDPALLTLFSDQVLRRIVITGRPDLGMPTFVGTDGRDSDFKPLTSEQIDDLVALLAHWRSSPPKIASTATPRQ
jgi:cytochrome c oxidase cbb3-type subunit III